MTPDIYYIPVSKHGTIFTSCISKSELEAKLNILNVFVDLKVDKTLSDIELEYDIKPFTLQEYN